jgi:2-keto-3-deoxy-L-rhamnonate aldolase RhmA
MAFRPNYLRKLLDEGKPTFSVHQLIVDPAITEILGHIGGIDYIEFVAEYATYDPTFLDTFCRAVGNFPGLSSMIKVEQDPRMWVTQRAIDSGFDSILFTDIRNAAEVKECLSYIHAETPEDGGVHGAGSRRINGYGAGIGDAAEWCQAMRDIVVNLMIEKEAAMENLDEILEIDRVDMLQFGPADYSISIGKPGQMRDEGVQKKHREMIEKALKAGKHPRVEAPTVEFIQQYWDMGVRHFCVGWDRSVIAQWTRKNSEDWQKFLADNVK